LFLLQYVVQRGFLGGSHGLIVASMSALYLFMKWAKLWHISQNAGQRRP
jgi:hypothetical protein